jgi:cysteine desulfurase
MVIETCREDVARVIGATVADIIFTGSGTEADNLALMGTMRANRARGNHLIVSAIEHKAVLAAAHALEREGFRLSVLPVNAFGAIDIETCLSLITEHTVLLSLMYVNNEIGTALPIRELARKLREKRAGMFPLLHTDACQASNLYSLDVRELGVDLLTVNSSKLYGPVGAGFLYRRKDIALEPIITGGEQEQNLRAGTESVPQIVGLTKAFLKAQAMREIEYKRLLRLQEYFMRELKRHIPSIRFNGDPQARTPSIVHVSVPFVEGESMLLKLDEAGIFVSTGSACSSFDLRPSHVLTAIGQDADLMHGSVRFSLGRFTTQDELDYVLEVFPNIVSELLSLSALTIVHPKTYTQK